MIVYVAVAHAAAVQNQRMIQQVAVAIRSSLQRFEQMRQVREALRLLLKAEGYRIDAVASPEAVTEELASEEFDILLTDLGLPDIPGDMVIRHVVTTARRRPWVVVVTGYDEPFIGRARGAGADVVLTKPIAWSQLLDRLVPNPSTPLAA